MCVPGYQMVLSIQPSPATGFNGRPISYLRSNGSQENLAAVKASASGFSASLNTISNGDLIESGPAGSVSVGGSSAVAMTATRGTKSLTVGISPDISYTGTGGSTGSLTGAPMYVMDVKAPAGTTFTGTASLSLNVTSTGSAATGGYFLTAYSGGTLVSSDYVTLNPDGTQTHVSVYSKPVNTSSLQVYVQAGFDMTDNQSGTAPTAQINSITAKFSTNK